MRTTAWIFNTLSQALEIERSSSTAVAVGQGAAATSFPFLAQKIQYVMGAATHTHTQEYKGPQVKAAVLGAHNWRGWNWSQDGRIEGFELTSSHKNIKTTTEQPLTKNTGSYYTKKQTKKDILHP